MCLLDLHVCEFDLTMCCTFMSHPNHSFATNYTFILIQEYEEVQRQRTIAKFWQVPPSCLIFLLKQQCTGFGFQLSFFFRLRGKLHTSVTAQCFKLCFVSFGNSAEPQIIPKPNVVSLCCITFFFFSSNESLVERVLHLDKSLHDLTLHCSVSTIWLDVCNIQRCNL